MFIADTEDQRIRKVAPDGTVTTIAGSGNKGSVDGVGVAASFGYPHGIAYCTSNQALYVADTDNNEIRKVTLDGTVTTVAGALETGYADGAGAVRFNHPHGIACDAAGNLFIADTDNNVIRMIAPTGVVSTLAGSKEMGTVDATGSAARFSNPTDLWYDGAEHALYVIDFGDNNVRKVTTPY
jgi:DNA-binding beta-propeller fold protein YncE